MYDVVGMCCSCSLAAIRGERDWTDSARCFDWEGADSVSSFLIDSYMEVEIQLGW